MLVEVPRRCRDASAAAIKQQVNSTQIFLALFTCEVIEVAAASDVVSGDEPSRRTDR
jgi:hypothetical protein